MVLWYNGAIMMKICSKCGVEKDSSEFYKTSGNRCKECHNTDCDNRRRKNLVQACEASKRWYHRKPENRQRSIDNSRRWQAEHLDRDKLNKFKHNLLKNYGLSYNDYCKMVEEQNGACAICGCIPNRALDVDHDHSTGKIRQLLCAPCKCIRPRRRP